MSDKIKVAAVIIVVVILFALGILYQVYQFNLCYPEVSDSWWYCFQHAFGGN